MKKSALLLAAAVSFTCACTKEEQAKPPPKPVEAPKPAEAPKPVEAAPTAAKSLPECVGPMADAPVETFEVGGKTYERKGSTVTQTSADPDDELVVGQLTDIKDHTPENAANIKAALAWFKENKVDVIAVTGDLGESAESITAVLNDVATAGVPVLAMVGNRECRDHFTKGVAAAQAAAKNVVNMNTVRVFNTDEVSFVSMPGYYNPQYIHCAEGCQYQPSDVAELPKFAEKATAPVKLLVSHGPPQQKGEKAIDRIHEGANVGDPELTKVMQSGLFPFGLFGNIQEAGGYATDLAGGTRIAPDTFADSLYLNPGPVDSVRWVMLDGTESVGMAGLLHVKGKQAKYKVFRVKGGDGKVAAPSK